MEEIIVDLKQRIIEYFATKFKINIKNIEYFVQAYTHASFTNEHKNYVNYDLLEFLGDSIINFLSTQYITLQLINKSIYDEGIATRIKSGNVNNTSLAEISKENNLGDFLLCGNSSKDQLNKNPAILADIFESTIGAIFLDSSIEEVKKFLTASNFFKNFNFEDKKSYKTTLQEHFAQISNKPIKYECIETEDRQFKCTVNFNSLKYGVGIGNSKKNAEENAAKNALENKQD